MLGPVDIEPVPAEPMPAELVGGVGLEGALVSGLVVFGFGAGFGVALALGFGAGFGRTAGLETALALAAGFADRFFATDARAPWLRAFAVAFPDRAPGFDPLGFCDRLAAGVFVCPGAVALPRATPLPGTVTPRGAT